MSTKHHDVEECYLNLGLSSGCSWKDVRSSYKKLAQINHPDRHKEGSAEQQKALVKFKLINESFKTLSTLYQDNESSLSISDEESAPPIDATSAEPDNLYDLHSNTGQNYKSKQSSLSKTNKTSHSSGSTKRSIGSFTIVVTVISVFWLALYKSNEPVIITGEDLERLAKLELEAELEASSEIEIQKSLLSEILNSGNKGKHYKSRITFTFGSPMTTVLSAQGAPTSTSGKSWTYGSSIVNFDSNGKVSDWRSHPDTPLNTHLE